MDAERELKGEKYRQSAHKNACGREVYPPQAYFTRSPSAFNCCVLWDRKQPVGDCFLSLAFSVKGAQWAKSWSLPLEAF
jgi:hypothetical protein